MRKLFSRPDWRSFFLSTLALLGALLAASAIAVLITAIQHQSDQRRQAQIVLMRLDRKVYQLHDLEMELSANPDLIQTEMPHLDALNQEFAHCLEPLPASARSSKSWHLVQETLAWYQQAVSQEMLTYLNGQAPQARRVHDERVNAAADALTEAIHAADTENNAAALQANHDADVGTDSVLIAAALLVFVLVRRFEGARRRGMQLATEQNTLRRSEQRFHALIRNASDVIAIVTPDGTFRYLSSAVQRVWGYEAGALEESSVFALLHPEEAERFRALMAQAQASQEVCLPAELRLHTVGEDWRVFEVVLTNLLTEPGIEGIVLTCRDVSERKAFEEHLAHQAFHDSLTHLPNRALFMDRLEHTLARSRRQEATIAVLFLDLDNFKVINDSLGHEAGDRLLMIVAERLSLCVRPGDTVARLGGDEFTILLEDLTGEEQIRDLAERITEAIHTPILLSNREIVMSGSLGIASARGGEWSPAQLLRDADTAMYQAKTSGKARSVVFTDRMNIQAMERLELEIDLRHALETGEQLRLFYQPIMALASSSIREVEALVRWEHSERGLLLPGEFIPLAEETGLILPLGRWVMREACRQAYLWQMQFPEEPPLVVSVNVSSRQLQQPDLVMQVVSVLKETKLLPKFLKLEITESVMMEDPEAIIPRLHDLRSLGVRLAVDDFGTGYSSMSYLNTLPIDTLKIDRSFVARMSSSEEDAAIVRAIVTLAKTLNLGITSEGIETADQSALLLELGCELGQGFLFARPMSAESLCQLLETRHCPERMLLKAA